MRLTERRVTALVMVGITIATAIPIAIWLVADPQRFWVDIIEVTPELGRIPLGWMIAAVLVVAYVLYSRWAVPEVRRSAFRLDGLKALAVPLAIVASTLEELLFRKLLMDWLARLDVGWALQILASGFAFGLAHGLWVVFSRDARLIPYVTVPTTALGIGLAITYLASDRLILPAIIAHIAINLVIEPGLLRSSVNGGWREAPHARTHDAEFDDQAS